MIRDHRSGSSARTSVSSNPPTDRTTSVRTNGLDAVNGVPLAKSLNEMFVRGVAFGADV